MYPRPSRLAEVLRDGGVALGSLTLLQEPAIGEILGALGYDFVVVDTEHAAADEQSVLAMVRAAGAAGTTPLVRLRRIEEEDLLGPWTAVPAESCCRWWRPARRPPRRPG